LGTPFFHYYTVNFKTSPSREVRITTGNFTYDPFGPPNPNKDDHFWIYIAGGLVVAFSFAFASISCKKKKGKKEGMDSLMPSNDEER